MTMGLSPGWRDIYPDDLWLQWVDISQRRRPATTCCGPRSTRTTSSTSRTRSTSARDTPFTVPGYSPLADARRRGRARRPLVAARSRRGRRHASPPPRVPHRGAAGARHARPLGRRVVRRRGGRVHAGPGRCRRRVHLQRPRDAARRSRSDPPRATVVLNRIEQQRRRGAVESVDDLRRARGAGGRARARGSPRCSTAATPNAVRWSTERRGDRPERLVPRSGRVGATALVRATAAGGAYDEKAIRILAAARPAAAARPPARA